MTRKAADADRYRHDHCDEEEGQQCQRATDRLADTEAAPEKISL
jgi:hypothetical protein